MRAMRVSCEKQGSSHCTGPAARRKQKGTQAPNITAVPRALKGTSEKRDVPQERGRKCKLTKAQARKLNTVRVFLLKKDAGEAKVTYKRILQVGRQATKVCSTISFQANGFDIRWSSAHKAQTLDKEARAERLATCKRWKFMSVDYFTHRVGAFLDTKIFRILTYHQALRSLKQGYVKGHCSQGRKGIPLLKEARRNRVNRERFQPLQYGPYTRQKSLGREFGSKT